MENTIKETTRLLLQGTLTKDEADKILLDLHNVMPSVCPACNGTKFQDLPRWKCTTCGDLRYKAN